jgi:O-antigen/teichoic acid export membrane protein
MHLQKKSINELLNSVQLILKTDIRYIIHGGTYLTLGQIFAGLAGFTLTIGLVRILNQAEYGLYTYIFSLSGMATIFTLSGMDTVVTQAVAKGSPGVLINAFWSKLKWSVPSGVITLCVGAYYLFKDNEILGTSLLIIGIFSPLLYASSLYASYFNGKKQFKKLAIDNALKNAFVTFCILLTAYFTGSVILIILTYFLSNTLISTVRYLILVKRINTADRGEFDAKSLNFGKHLSIMDSFSNISTYVDKIIVFQLLGAHRLHSMHSRSHQ